VIRRANSRSLAVSIALLVMAMVSVQTGASLAKSLFAAVGPQGAAALRLAFAGVIMLAVWRPWRGGLSRAEARAVLAYGLALGGMNLLFYLSLSTLPLGLAVTLEFAGPLTLAAAGSRRARDLIWIGLAALGILTLLRPGRESGAIDPRGALFALAAGGCWALYILFGQKAGATLHSGRAAALGMIVAALVVVPVGVAHAGARLLSPALAPLGLGVAILSSALPYTLEMVAMKRLPTRTFGVLMSLEPAVAALSGLILLGERLDARRWVGVASVMAASLGAAATARADRPPPPPPSD
jgi:inner membrane transporter RhtA